MPEKLKMSDIKFANSTGLSQILTAPTEKSGGNLSSELELIKKLRLPGPSDEDSQDQSDDQIEEENHAAPQGRSPRSKQKKK